MHLCSQAALLCSTCLSLIHCTLPCMGVLHSAPVRSVQCFSSSWGNRVLSRKEVPEGSWLIYTEVPAPSLWLACSHAVEDSKSLQFHCSKRHCPDQSKWSHSDWSVKMLMEIQLHISNWTGKVSVLLVEIQFQELLYKGWLRRQEHSAERQAVQCSLLSEMRFAWEAPVKWLLGSVFKFEPS